MVSSQIFKRYPQTNHYLLSPSLFPGFMEYEPTMISFLSFCSYVSCASPASPSCSSQVMPNPDTPLLKVLQKWKLLKLNESSMGLITVFCVYMIKFFHGKKLKKKKRPRPSKGFPSEKPKSLQQCTALGPCEATFSLLLFVTTSGQSHNLLPAQLPPESFCTRCLLCLEHSFPVYLHALLLFRICRNAIFWRASMAHPTLI